MEKNNLDYAVDLFKGITRDGVEDLYQMIEWLEELWINECTRLKLANDVKNIERANEVVNKIKVVKQKLHAPQINFYKIEALIEMHEKKTLKEMDFQKIHITYCVGKSQSQTVSARSWYGAYAAFVQKLSQEHPNVIDVAFLDSTAFGLHKDLAKKLHRAVPIEGGFMETQYGTREILKRLIKWRKLIGCKPSDFLIGL